MSAIAGTHNSGVVLTTAHYSSPVTIASGAVVNGSTTKYGGDAVYSKTVAWAVVNNGTVAGKADGSGIHLAAGGVLTNNRLILGGGRGVEIVGTSAAAVANSGTIEGSAAGGAGILLFPGGTITNGRRIKLGGFAEGTVTGVGNGIQILGAGGSVSNIGTIEGTSGYGVWLEAGGAVSNSRGLIDGHRDGVFVQNGSGTVTNFASLTSSGDGVKLTSGGTVINGQANATGASISGDTGVALSGAAGFVSNFGLIYSSTLGIDLAAGGSVVNRNAISGGMVGIRAGGGATVSNYGTITTTLSYGILLKAGGIVANDAEALIDVPNRAVAIKNGAGSVTNFGTIAAASYLAVYLTTGSLTNGASGSNAGLIEAYSAAVRIGGGTAGGTITNFGTITATATTSGLGIVLFAGTLRNLGLVHGSLDGVAVITEGTIDNLGTITGSGPPQSGSYGVSLQGGGAVVNGATGSAAAMIAGDGGISIADSGGSVVNFGMIAGIAEAAAYGGSGVRLQQAGVLANYGTIAGAGADLHGLKFGAELDGGGTVANGGSNALAALIAGSDGVYAAVAAATVTNSGTIIGLGTVNGGAFLDGRGVYLKDGGTIANAGLIETTATGIFAQGIYLFDGGGIRNEAAGRIIGYEQGIFSAHTIGRVTNFGTIEITGTGMQSFGVYLDDGGQVTNGATGAAAPLIAGYNAGVYNTNAPATVVNFGTIEATGTSGRGVDLSQGLVVRNGGSGAATALIRGADYGVRMPDAPGMITNFATITATGSAGVGAYLGDGGVLSNRPGGSIRGTLFGFLAAGGPATAINFGTVAATGPNGVGLALRAGGGLTVGAKGETTGKVGAEITGGSGTIANFGTISGTGGTAVSFGKFDDRLVIAPGAAFLGTSGKAGKAIGGAGHNTIELAGAAPGAFAGLGTQFVDFTTVTVDAGAAWQVEVTPSALAGERIAGAGGKDQLVLTAAGSFNLSAISGFPVIRVTNSGANALTLHNANFTGVPGKTIQVQGGIGGIRVNANLAAGNRLVLAGARGADVFTLSRVTLAGSTVQGEGGADILVATGSGAITVAGVEGIERFVLAGAAHNSLSLSNKNFIGVTRAVITVTGGNKGNTISEAAVAAVDTAILKGGAGADIMIAGRHAAMTGGAGADLFELTAPGSTATPDKNTIADFKHNLDKLALGKAGFALGSSPLAATLFTASKNGGFTTAAQRFAYNTTNGKLFYDAHGNARGSSQQLIATLTTRPTLTAGDIRFVS